MSENDINKSCKILNIAILYANENEVIEYARELSNQSISEYINLVIVINKIGDMSEENFTDNLKRINLNMYIFNPGYNLGYLNGLIYGYNQYTNQHESSKWIVMSNTDISFSKNNFFEDFLKKEYDETVWLVGPSIYSLENKSYDNPQYKSRHTLNSINRRIFIFTRPILSYYYLKIASIKAKLRKREKQTSQYAYSLHGCFFFVNQNFIEILKRKKYGPLLYSEEAYLAELIRLKNKKCYYNSEIEIIHMGSTVTGKLEIEKKSKYFLESLVYIKKEFYVSELGNQYIR